MSISAAQLIDFLGDPRIGAHFGDARPVWLWDASGRRILWANAAGTRFFRARTLAALAGRDFSRGGVAGHIARLATSGADRPKIVQLRLYRGMTAVSTPVLCTVVERGDADPVVLGIGLNEMIDAPEDAEQRLSDDCAVLGGNGLRAAVIDADGAIVAAGPGFPAPADIPDTVAAAVGSALSHGATAATALSGAFAGRRMLISRLGDTGKAIALLATPGEAAALAADPAAMATAWPGVPVPSMSERRRPAEPAAAPGDGTPDLPKDWSSDDAPQGNGEKRTDLPPMVQQTIATPSPVGEARPQPDEDATDAPESAPEPAEADAGPTEETSELSASDAEEGIADAGEETDDAAVPPADVADETISEDAPAEAAEESNVAEAAADEDIPSPAPTAAEAPASVPHEAPTPAAFTFKRRERPHRFVWQMDTDGTFTFVSHEFADAVGPAAASIVDRTWPEVAERYRLAKADEVSAAISKQDTWSGITVDWPVEGTDLRVPVDLAALPAFGRGREFEGYRGFGVCRTMEAEFDPLASGRHLGDGIASDVPDGTDAPDTENTETAETADTAASVTAVGLTSGAMDEIARRIQSSGDETPEEAETAAEPEAEDEGPAATEAEPAGEPEAESEIGATADPEEPADDIAEREADVFAPELRYEPRDEPPAILRTTPSAPLLSKPELQAFRQIADALGARLEGDDDEVAETALKTDGAEAENVVPLPSAFASYKPRQIDPSLLDRLPVGVLIARDQTVIYANQPMLDLIAYDSLDALDEAGGLDAIIVGPGEEADGPSESDAGGPADRYVRLRRRDDDLVSVMARLHAVPWNDGNALMMSFRPAEEPGSSRPRLVAERPAESPELASARHRVRELETILDTATDGTLILDGDGTILGVNASAEALFGSDREAMIGRRLVQFLAPESRRSATDYLDGLTRNGVASLLNDGREVIGLAAQGGLIPLFMTIGRLDDTSERAGAAPAYGGDRKYCAVLRDITQWKKAEEELTASKRKAEDASSQKSDFLAKISHEIRTPLNGIIGFSEVMMEERFGPIGNDRYRDYLRDIHTSGEHIMSLVNDLLDLSKIEAGKLELTFEAVSPAEIIQEGVALLQPQANRARIIIRTSLPASVPKVVADPRSLRQIVLNLLSNAIKFNTPGGQVIVSTALEDNGEVTLRVRDTGVGMSEREIEMALEPFRQLHTSRFSGGTGLGLPLTKALAEANRASFAITSDHGSGTLVEISFPTTRVLAE
ncbi:ATP-binding protein [Rhodobium gokarnense]|uniref:histidine kinase n=1 Tax=Rhodobium gokarnense TaxID=364296 RepID=A0ABT3HCE9_9HYPH|nr:ATP-binding protein [Rhodobium gokarnense]MCW2308079.1 PAS domain S-box-containing protein [Rhodobium gokarnense]